MGNPDRTPITHLDGTPIFQTQADRDNEAAVGRRVGEKWRCEFHHFAPLSPIDWYATRHGRIIGIAELKTRRHAAAERRTVCLMVRKWLALMLAQAGLGVPALWLVQFTDEIRWCRVAAIDAGAVHMGGHARHRAEAENARAGRDLQSHEPVIEVPIAWLTPLER